MAFCPGEHGAHTVDGVGRVGDQGDIARVQEAERGVADALFGADQRQDFGIRVQLDVETGVVPLSEGAAHLRQAVGLRIPVVWGMLGRRQQPVDDGLRGGYVGVTDAEGNHVGPGGTLLSDDPRDLNERIGGQFPQTLGKFHHIDFSSPRI